MGTWDSRFGDVKAIALNEMNAIISAQPSIKGIANIDEQFIYPMPVDVRKSALKGDYVVDVNLYGETRQTLGGPIAIKAELFTDFGKPTQKRKMINLRVANNKEVVNIGSLKFGS